MGEASFLSDLYNDKHAVVKRAVRSSVRIGFYGPILLRPKALSFYGLSFYGLLGHDDEPTAPPTLFRFWFHKPAPPLHLRHVTLPLRCSTPNQTAFRLYRRVPACKSQRTSSALTPLLSPGARRRETPAMDRRAPHA